MKTLSNQSKFFILQPRSEWDGKVRNVFQGSVSEGGGEGSGNFQHSEGNPSSSESSISTILSICCKGGKREASFFFRFTTLFHSHLSLTDPFSPGCYGQGKNPRLPNGRLPERRSASSRFRQSVPQTCHGFSGGNPVIRAG